MPVALRVEGLASSREVRSRGRDGVDVDAETVDLEGVEEDDLEDDFVAVLGFTLGFDGNDASSSASCASRSAFLRRASAFLAASASLDGVRDGYDNGEGRKVGTLPAWTISPRTG